jgi:large-conductance mechanosensitive channel
MSPGMHRKEEAKVAAPSAEEKLLVEIRDLLKYNKFV